MDVFLMIRQKNITIFTDAKETTPVLELKRIIQGILKVAPKDQHLWKDEREMDDDRCLADYGLISSTARAQSPATIALATHSEKVDITLYSSPPELPDVMKPQPSGNENSIN